MGDDELFSAQGLDVNIGGSPLVVGAAIRLMAGDVVCLHGSSGCGKTSLLRALCGLVEVSGDIRLRGKTPSEYGWPVFRRRVAYLPQRPVLFDCSVIKNLSMPFEYASSVNGFPRAEAMDLLARLGLDDCLEIPNALELSVGQQQRLCLVRALLCNPDVLLLDEPTSALDESSRLSVENVICEYVESAQSAALIVTHDSGLAERVNAKCIGFDSICRSHAEEVG